MTEENISDCAAFEDPEHYVHYAYLDGNCVFRHALQCSGSIYFSETYIKALSENERYIHYAYCAPQARGNAIHKESTVRLCSLYPDSDVYVIVALDNIASLKAYIYAGFKIKSRIRLKWRLFRSYFIQEEPTSEDRELEKELRSKYF